MKSQFLLRPDITFLNFGSFGATPKLIFEEYQRFQLELEREPVQFILNQGPNYLKESRKALADYIHADERNLIFVPNPTHAVNLIARNNLLNPGDEVLSTSLEYGACDRTWRLFTEQASAKYIQSEIRLPIQSKAAFLEDFWKGYSEKTKLIFISQITSVTGLILPVKEICEEAKKRGLITFVDGAHVPGHIPLDLNELQVDFYTGACHKWMMTPKGSSFIYVDPKWHEILKPLIVSWGYDADFPSDSTLFDYHQFNGTRDFSAYLTIPKALEFRKMYHWEDVIREARNRVQDWLPRLCTLVNSQPLAPIGDEFIGQLGSIPIQCDNPTELKERLYHEFNIEIPVMVQNDKVYLRFSLNGFNDEKDMYKLEEVIKRLIADGTIEI